MAEPGCGRDNRANATARPCLSRRANGSVDRQYRDRRAGQVSIRRARPDHSRGDYASAGVQTGWHTHPVPLFGYIIEGELTVDYGTKGKRTYLKGDGLAEAMNEAHNGHNMGPHPVKILAVFIGMEGVQGTAPASPPAH
jgi:mannose-6-phosphate isomerase-like protein (cupin superfamily)